MNSDTSSDLGRRRRPPRRPRILAVTVGLMLLTAACAGSPSPAGSGGSAQPTGSSYHKALAYSQCMRSNGVPGYPDPIVNANGTITFSRPGTTTNTSQSRLQAAEETCQHLLPSGSQPSQAHQQQQLTSELKFAQCMRSHGVPNWPDPTLMGTEYEFNLHAENISLGDPRIEAAERTCQSQLHLSPSQVHLPV